MSAGGLNSPESTKHPEDARERPVDRPATWLSRYPHYHDPEDTIDKVDFGKMARVVRGMEKVVAELVGEDRK